MFCYFSILQDSQAFRSSFCEAEAAEKAAWTQKAKAEALGRREAAELDALQAECALQGRPKSTREPTVVNREAQQKSLADDKAKLEVELANVRSARPPKLSHVSHVSHVMFLPFGFFKECGNMSKPADASQATSGGSSCRGQKCDQSCNYRGG